MLQIVLASLLLFGGYTTVPAQKNMTQTPTPKTIAQAEAPAPVWEEPDTIIVENSQVPDSEKILAITPAPAEDTKAPAYVADETKPAIPEPAEPTWEEGKATYYGWSWDGAKTASGKKLSCSGLQAAHKTLPFGTQVEVCSADEATCFTVEIVDRGPYGAGRIIDLTPAAFTKLAPLSRGVVPVKIRVLP